MNTLFQKRRADLARWMAANNVQAVVFEDTEGRRSPAVRYYTNHPEDAILVINNKAETVYARGMKILLNRKQLLRPSFLTQNMTELQ